MSGACATGDAACAALTAWDATPTLRPLRLVLKLAFAALALVLALAAWVVAGLPARSEVQALARRSPETTALMRQRAEEARARRQPVRREQSWVPLAAVSRSLIQAVLVAEDIKFLGHEGVDWQAIRESLERDVRERRFARGGSTITQQLAKNLFLSTRKDPVRKLRELVVAYWLEADLSKRRILELYLNVIEWGDGVYGCEAAARRYYGMSAADLGEQEAAGLAAMIPNPRRINPQSSPARHARAQKRILWLMARAGYVKQGTAGLGAEPPEEPAEAPEDPAEPFEQDEPEGGGR
jgi:monofunctional biosynthetic peptidoglycan transglycosylase